MKNISNLKSNSQQSMLYQIRIRGHLGSQWSDWFEGLTIMMEDDGNTIISGPVLDDAALHGLLKRVRDLGMPLISVNRIESDPEKVIILQKRRKIDDHKRKNKPQ